MLEPQAAITYAFNAVNSRRRREPARKKQYQIDIDDNNKGH
jgi:hypothetical protein